MENNKRFLVDVALNNLPFPMKVLSRATPLGQDTVAHISVSARIMHEFEAQWINNFIHIVHKHRDSIGTKSMSKNIMDYFNSLNATMVLMDFEYPFFVEKKTPVSNEKCLVKYNCTYSVKKSSVIASKVLLKIEIPIITSYPDKATFESDSPFGQLSLVHIEIESSEDIFPESIIDVVEQNALSQVYSFLNEEDEAYLIKKIHGSRKTSVEIIDDIKNELSISRNIEWCSVQCKNYGMLHTYSTLVGTEKSLWVPNAGFEEDLESYL
jgi:GTP cyclohydrolase I